MTEGYEGKDKRRWHFGKEISISDFVIFTSALLTVLFAYTKNETRISLMEQGQLQQNAEIEKTAKRVDMQFDEIKRKLDWLIEKRAEARDHK